MSDDKLMKAREYEKRCAAFITKDERPMYHLTPMVGWMNDPNGFSYHDGLYHMYYQYNPYDRKWGPMHWGHAVSSDLVRWEYEPCALAPDGEYDCGGCFSGSAISLPDGRLLLIYTGMTESEMEDGTRKSRQVQCLALGDGYEFEKLEGNPVMDEKVLPEGFSTEDFRDPKIWKDEEGYWCVTGSRTGDGNGAVLLFQSPDAFHWSFVTVLDRAHGDYGRMWECPDFFRLGDKDILVTCPQDMSPVGMEFHSGNCTAAFIGSYDREKRVFRREKVQAVDYGLDFYAPQSILSPDGRRIMVAWMQNWDACVAVPGAKWIGQLTVAREVEYRDGRVVSNPVRELEKYREGLIRYDDVLVTDEAALQGVFGRHVDITVNVKCASSEPYRIFRMKVAQGSNHYTSVSYCPESSTLRVSRAHSGMVRDFVHERNCLVRDNGGEIKLRILVDRYSVEVFVNDGEQVLSTAIQTPMSADGISFYARGMALVSVEKYDLVF